MRERLMIGFFLGACATAVAAAGEVYKCTTEAGTVAFQDQPCAAGETETTVRISKPPRRAYAAPSAEEGMEPAEPADAPQQAQIHIGDPVQNFSTPLWSCIDGEDGHEYISRNGAPPPRMVPAGVMGIPGQTLAQAYRPGGIGVSAPGMRKIPIDRSPDAAIAGAYVAVEDHCQPAGKEQACAYLQKELDDVRQKLKRAFNSDRDPLQRQEYQLTRDMTGC